MITTLLTIIWIFLPVGLANTAPVLANNTPLLKDLKTPLDFGKTFRGKRIFGDHKTVRGIVAGLLMGLLVVSIQMVLFSQFEQLARYSYTIDYSSLPTLLLGAALGFGAVAGDAVKSFFKRQAGISPGKNWIPFDQLDFILGGIIFSFPFLVLPLSYYVVALCLALFIHPLANVISWMLGLQDDPF